MEGPCNKKPPEVYTPDGFDELRQPDHLSHVGAHGQDLPHVWA